MRKRSVVPAILVCIMVAGGVCADERGKVGLAVSYEHQFLTRALVGTTVSVTGYDGGTADIFFRTGNFVLLCAGGGVTYAQSTGSWYSLEETSLTLTAWRTRLYGLLRLGFGFATRDLVKPFLGAGLQGVFVRESREGDLSAGAAQFEPSFESSRFQAFISVGIVFAFLFVQADLSLGGPFALRAGLMIY